ncbi:MAG: PCRF domain-containing protein, partial [Rickettsiales bacterium]|nr:PCRF domain-containing protein [Rickettsiales bacterium]
MFDPDASARQLETLKQQTADPELWNDRARAEQLLREQKALEGKLQSFEALCRDLDDQETLIALGEEENDAQAITEAEAALAKLAIQAKRLETERLLSGEADANDCFLEIHPGAGGTESQDWAQMLERMYLRWAEQQGFEAQLLEEQDGDEAGIKSATIRIRGSFAYGWAKTESGVHRLVRISPFDSNHRRHTSFASVWVYPEVDDTIDISVLDKDLRVDTYRASGAGGQHVNRTDSAIR